MARAIRAAAALVATVLATTMLASPASAHVTPDKNEVPADSFNAVTLTVPHGCEESPTREIVVEIPEGILSASPEVHPGWTIAVEEEELAEPVEGEGEPVTERVASIRFTAEAGNELPAHYRDNFTIGFRTPDTPGEYLFFKTVQTCVEGETAWIEEYTGEGEEPEHPAPALLITEAAGEHGDEEAPEEDEEEAPDTDEVAAAADGDDDDGGSDGMATAALVIAILAAAAAGFSLYRTLRPTSTS